MAIYPGFFTFFKLGIRMKEKLKNYIKDLKLLILAADIKRINSVNKHKLISAEFCKRDIELYEFIIKDIENILNEKTS